MSEKHEDPPVENSEAYLKICQMLEEMNINPKDILPH